MRPDFVIREGDTAADFAATLKVKDAAGVESPADLQGATALTVTMTPIRGGVPLLDAVACENRQNGDGSDGTKGQVGRPWTAGETDDAAGYYMTTVTVSDADGNEESFPNEGYLLVAITPRAPETVGRYLTREQLKLTLELQGQTFADADIDVAIEAASRGMESRWGTIWRPGVAGEVRYYTAYDGRVLVLGDVLDTTEVALDYAYGDCFGDGFASSASGGAGAYATILPVTDYRLLPITNGASSRTPPGNGEPFRELQIARAATWPALPSGVDGVRITGTFGWEQVPAGVTAAASIIATRLFKRTREAPFGIHGIGLDQAIVRAVQFTYDPEVTFALDGVTAPRSLLV